MWNNKITPPAFSDAKASFEQLSRPTAASSPSTPKPTDNTANTMFPPKKPDIVKTKASIAEVINSTSIPSITGASVPALPTTLKTNQAESLPPDRERSSAPAASPTVTSPSPPVTQANPSTSTPVIAQLPTVAFSPAFLSVRPTGLRLPSWIGPPRPDRVPTPGIATMRQPVTIDFASKGLQPPVYIFTNLSDPQWSAVEMDCEQKDDGENRFHKVFPAEEGEYQYKFRLGPGDWWALDKSKSLVDDGQGNKNNQLVVEPVQSAQRTEVAPVVQPTTQEGQTGPALQPPTQDGQPQAAIPASSETVTERVLPAVAQMSSTAAPTIAAVPTDVKELASTMAPTLPHEDQTSSSQSAQAPVSAAATHADQPETPSAAPPLRHESYFPDEKAAADSGDVPPLWESNDNDTDPKKDEAEDDDNEEDDNDDSDDDDEANDDDSDDDEPEENTSPLLRHETLNTDVEHQAPLMRHESAAIGEHRMHGELYSAPADLDDPFLEKFPTDKNAILDHLHRTATQADADQNYEILSPSSVVVVDELGSPIGSLPSVQEEDDDDDVEPGPTVVALEEAGQRPNEPITPPLTPTEREEVVKVEKLMVERIAERQHEAAADAEVEGKREQVVAEIVQDRGLFGAVIDVALHPFSLLALAGTLLAVALGYWKVRYVASALPA
ncbi:hypothetical protein LTR62_002906 [Meristemomyces frigidus]|uniref:AMP-activated protein kinase glycogen-binding domain-containing protein n=1 Tax=Meristemomyces frigidus TaxID=1508187 RepID=A0AAN7TQM2_9PEZI|nr:hypothetical protein LTR62_002906 [Meristemomyces frigidus]